MMVQKERELGVIALMCLVSLGCATEQVLVSTGVANSSAYGLDVGAQQTVAVRFQGKAGCKLTRGVVWLMANAANTSGVLDIWKDDTSTPPGKYNPSKAVGGFKTQFVTTAQGWEPTAQSVDFPSTAVSLEDANYWLVAESDDAMAKNPVWLVGQEVAYSAINTDITSPWKPTDQKSGAPGFTLYADC